MRAIQIGTDGPVAAICLGAQVERMTVDIRSEGADFFPFIDLRYPRETRGSVLAIAQEAQRQERFPEVYIRGNEVIVLFLLPTFSRELFEKLHRHIPWKMLPSLAPKTFLVATAEAEISRETLDKFVQLFGRVGYFKLSLVKRGRRTNLPDEILWSTRLRTFGTELPF